jgi:hypothetical protein
MIRHPKEVEYEYLVEQMSKRILLEVRELEFKKQEQLRRMYKLQQRALREIRRSYE